MRHRQRHVHATIVGHIRSRLTISGWVNVPVNFGTTPVTVIDFQPIEAGLTPAMNTVAVSIGDQGRDEDLELGGGLYRTDFTVFIDVYGENAAIGIALADDIKEAIRHVHLQVWDFAAEAASEEWLEFENILIENVPSAASTLDKRNWRAVKATAVCYYGD